MLISSMPGLVLLQVAVVIALILANAFFVAAEFALVSIRDSRVEQLIANGVSGARAVKRLQQNLDDFLPATQLGVTLCSLALGWIGEPLAANMVLGWLGNLANASIYAHMIAVALGFALITYLHVLMGELVPKSLALRRVDALAVAVAPPMVFFMTLARPAVRFLKNSAAIVLRAFDIPLNERGNAHSPEELKLITSAAQRNGLLPRFQEQLIHRALEMEDVNVREIMTPRQKIVSLPASMLIEAASAQVIAHMHSRVPVYDDEQGPEHIIGVVYSKDLARLMFFRPAAQVGKSPSPFQRLKVSQVMRDVLVVPETKTVLDLIREFQQRRRQMAIVVDEFGSTVGLVTAEDAIEQLTGELDDEFDDASRPILTTATGALLMEGSVNLRDLETQMQWSLPRDAGVETLAGFILSQLGHIPDAGEFVEFDGRRLTVVEMESRRIARVRVNVIASEAEKGDEGSDAR